MFNLIKDKTLEDIDGLNPDEAGWDTVIDSGYIT